MIYFYMKGRRKKMEKDNKKNKDYRKRMGKFNLLYGT